MAGCTATVPVFKRLLEHGAKLEDSVPLNTAASAQSDTDRNPIIEVLLKLRVDVNAFDDLRSTYAVGMPLYSAVVVAGVEKVRFLLERRIDTYVRNRRGVAPLEAAEETGHAQSAELFRRAS